MKAGLEIHQQLAVGKLFCACDSELDEHAHGDFVRLLHATTGETGTTDRAALAQGARGWSYRYQVSDHSCLVEADEEPPHALNARALRVALTMASLLDARVVDEVQVMRKIVVDGSNTSGFQRTALIAFDGKLRIGARTYTIPSICLEEDAARKIEERAGQVVYRLDRLGIPLVEIATGPEIHGGEEAREVAETLGALLRATRSVRRGIGTIREDLNVSIDGGARVEIKGVQELRWVAKYAENEADRQRYFLELRGKLRERHASVPETPPTDVTDAFQATASKGVREVLRHDGRALAIALPGFAGLLGTAKTSPERLGRELADHARSTGTGGILHSDELPAYGVGDAEVQATRTALALGPPDRDAFVLVAAPPAAGRKALAAVRRRALDALEGVPEETRDPLPEGRTRYNRPLPGRHRMYPETDVAPIRVSEDLLRQVQGSAPERPEATLERLRSTQGLSAEVARAIFRSGEVPVLDLLVAQGHPSALVARLLQQELPPVEEELGGPIDETNWEPGSKGASGPRSDPDERRAALLAPVLVALKEGRFAKEGLGPVLRRMFLQKEDLTSAIRDAGLKAMTVDELEAEARQVVEANASLLAQRGQAAFQPLMGDLMARVRGRRDGKEVAAALRKAVEARLRTSPPPGGRSA